MPHKKSPKKSTGPKGRAAPASPSPKTDVTAEAAALAKKLAAEVKAKQAAPANKGEDKTGSAKGKDKVSSTAGGAGDHKTGSNDGKSGEGGGGEEKVIEVSKDEQIADLRRQLAAQDDKTRASPRPKASGKPGRSSARGAADERRRTPHRAAKDKDERVARKAQREEVERSAFARRGRAGGGDDGSDDENGDDDPDESGDDDFGYGDDDDEDEGDESDDDGGGGGSDDDSGDDFLQRGDNGSRKGRNCFDPISDRKGRRAGEKAVQNPRRVFEATLTRLRMRPTDYVRAETSSSKMGYDTRAMKELFPLAYAYEAVLGNRRLEALDVLAERIVAIHVAFKFRKGTKPNWELASALQERPGDGLVPREMFAALAKHASRARKLTGWKQPRAPKPDKDSEKR